MKVWTGNRWRRVDDADVNKLRAEGYLLVDDDATEDAPPPGQNIKPATHLDRAPDAAATSAGGDPFDPRGTPTQLPATEDPRSPQYRSGHPGVPAPRPATTAPTAPAPAPTTKKPG